MTRIGVDARMLHDGGIGRYVGELLEAYPELVRNEEIVVFAHPRDALDVRRRAHGIEIVPLSAPVFSVREHVEFAWQVRRVGLDLLHLPHYVPPMGVRCPLVVTIHDLTPFHFPRSRFHAMYGRRMLNEVRTRASLVLTPSQAIAGELEELAGIEPERIRVVPGGVSPHWQAASTGPEVDAFLRRMRLSPPYLLNVTNGLPHKGLRTLLEAFRDLLPEAVRVDPEGLRLVLAGWGSDREEVLDEIAACGLPADTVLPLGGISEREMRFAYASATAVVVASDHEGFGLPALEGFAAGVPVVASDAGGLPEIVGNAGISFPAGSVAHLREALYRVAFEFRGGEREKLVHRGLAQARRFTWEGTARATLAAYERALGT